MLSDGSYYPKIEFPFEMSLSLAVFMKMNNNPTGVIGERILANLEDQIRYFCFLQISYYCYNQGPLSWWPACSVLRTVGEEILCRESTARHSGGRSDLDVLLQRGNKLCNDSTIDNGQHIWLNFKFPRPWILIFLSKEVLLISLWLFSSKRI